MKEWAMPEQRPPAVAGTFYPSDSGELKRVVTQYLESAEEHEVTAKALIVPHAGYVYSGPVAATAYACLAKQAEQIERVALFGPAHTYAFSGMAAPSVKWFATPLGNVPIDTESVAALSELPGVQVLDTAHSREHCLEVQLPFLQVVLGERFQIVPIVVGHCPAEQVAAAMESLWGGPETLVLVSSDLSHYLDYHSAVEVDRRTCRAIQRLSPDEIQPQDACGATPIRGLLIEAKRHSLRPTLLDLRNSGDTAGPRDHVVGYAAVAFEPAG